MTYTPTNWVDGATPLNRTNMMRIENELALLDGSSSLVAVSPTPPAGPVDGQLWYYSVAVGVTWVFRYFAGSTSAYKWEFVGGPPLYATFATGETIPATSTFSDLSGPQIGLARAGVYDVIGGGQFISSGVLCQLLCYPGVLGQAVTPQGNQYLTCVASERVTLTVAGNAHLQYWANGSASVANRWIRVTPVNVS